jgi:hypothetical protein
VQQGTCCQSCGGLTGNVALHVLTQVCVCVCAWFSAAGLDYTVAHYGIITSSPRLDAVLTFVDDSTPQAADDWSVGEVSVACARKDNNGSTCTRSSLSAGSTPAKKQQLTV